MTDIQVGTTLVGKFSEHYQKPKPFDLVVTKIGKVWFHCEQVDSPINRAIKVRIDGLTIEEQDEVIGQCYRSHDILEALEIWSRLRLKIWNSSDTIEEDVATGRITQDDLSTVADSLFKRPSATAET